MAIERPSDADVRAAQRCAEQFVAASRPGCAITNTRLRAKEPSRHVFAVFYAEPGVMVVPGRYVLVAVSRAGGEVVELETSPASPYWMRGFK
jgi:hypothetical protein